MGELEAFANRMVEEKFEELRNQNCNAENFEYSFMKNLVEMCKSNKGKDCFGNACEINYTNEDENLKHIVYFSDIFEAVVDFVFSEERNSLECRRKELNSVYHKLIDDFLICTRVDILQKQREMLIKLSLLMDDLSINYKFSEYERDRTSGMPPIILMMVCLYYTIFPDTELKDVFSYIENPCKEFARIFKADIQFKGRWNKYCHNCLSSMSDQYSRSKQGFPINEKIYSIFEFLKSSGFILSLGIIDIFEKYEKSGTGKK